MKGRVMKRRALLLLALMLSALTLQAQQSSDSREAVYVMGSVSVPQAVKYDPELTLRMALAMAGGAKRDADKKRLKIFRLTGDDKKRETIVVNLDDIKKGKADDFALKPYDIICVPDKKSKGANCDGQVRPLDIKLPSQVVQ
jgi:protein involved in polysaccharide export with SLBB domain